MQGPLQQQQGLSPRLRGNLDLLVQSGVAMRSIPALAGEPLVVFMGAALIAVYPRACGGTITPPRKDTAPAGLSPRLRGNRGAADVQLTPGGSIPALAGEPESDAKPSHDKWVYPRACGGTPRALPNSNLVTGLSPRLRGNQTTMRLGCGYHRSIPALAGEPRSWATRLRMSRVYPRACGGTNYPLQKKL